MKGISQLFLGMMTAAGSIVLVLAAASLSLIEGGFAIGFVPSPTFAPAIITEVPGSISLPTEPLNPTQTSVQPTPCQFPADWVEYSVLPGDTLDALASETGVSVEEIYSLNCLDSTYIMAGMVLRLPNRAPTSTAPPALPTAAPPLPTALLCGPYPGWIVYVVQPGDNLFRLSMAFGVNVSSLQFANCLRGETIYAGQRLYVPNVATRTPRPTNTPFPTATAFPSATPIPATPTVESLTPTVVTPATEPPPTTETPAPTTETPQPATETALPATATLDPAASTTESEPTDAALPDETTP
jgi:LysM repeat protein